MQDDLQISVGSRVELITGMIMAGLGVENKVSPLEITDLKGNNATKDNDGVVIINKISSFLEEKNLPSEKKAMIINDLSRVFIYSDLWKAVNGESKLKTVYTNVKNNIMPIFTSAKHLDFTGKLFNVLNEWVDIPDSDKNDVVMTPRYVTELMAKLCMINKDSYVWDFATGSAGLLVAAMNEMIIDAKEKITSPLDLEQKQLKIKAEQLLGLEVLSNIYMLAILNMILMGDGSSNILNKDSLTDFDGKYSFGKADEKFPATAFVLNPPYSAEGNGMVFVEKALSMMNKGYAAIIIQNSAGSGKAKELNKKILTKNTLLASIKMPIDLFIGKSSVQTNVYVFRVGEAHQKDEVVKFIDFSNDGYTRTNRKKASINLRDTDRAKERYQEVVDLVRFGKSKLNIFTEKEYYEGHIDPGNGSDWNQTAPVDTRPTLEDFKKTVADYLAWEVSNLIKNTDKENERLKK